MEEAPASSRHDLCQACAIRNKAICSDLDPREIDILNGIGRRRRLAAGEQLMWEGHEAVLVANVIEGILKLSSHSADGKEQILGLVYPSDFLGRPFGETSPYSVEALTDPTSACSNEGISNASPANIRAWNTSFWNARWANWTGLAGGCCYSAA